MPAANPPRWITVRKPFDYRWPDRSALTAYREADLGEHLVKGEVADYAVAGGYATEGKLDGSEAKAPKGKRAKKGTSKPKAAKPDPDAATSDNGPDARVDGEDVPPAGGTEVRSAVDPVAD